MFFVVFFSLYSGLHLYALVKFRLALNPDLRVLTALGAFMALMVFAPALVRILEHHQLEAGARITACLGYLWMGLLFVFVCWSLLIDAYRSTLWLAGRFSGRQPALFQLDAGPAFLLPLTLSAGIMIYGYFEALKIRTEHLTIRTDKLPEGVERFRIVQISDVHLGLIVRENRLGRIIGRITAAAPDLLVSTGDLIDGQPDALLPLARRLGDVEAPYGKFAVTGNHEFYAGLDTALKLTRAAGFEILRGESRDVKGVLGIAGVDDPAGEHGGHSRVLGEPELLSTLDRGRFAILLKHRPQIEPAEAGMFDLQLSGHTHRGQIFPFSLLVARAYPKLAGLFAIGEDRYLYVSRGTGTWGPPVRFLAPPEVTVIDLVNQVNGGR